MLMELLCKLIRKALTREALLGVHLVALSQQLGAAQLDCICKKTASAAWCKTILRSVALVELYPSALHEWTGKQAGADLQ